MAVNIAILAVIRQWRRLSEIGSKQNFYQKTACYALTEDLCLVGKIQWEAGK